MIEKIILDYLESVLTCPVYMEEPEDKPAKFVLIQKTGGRMTNMISYSTVAIQSYDQSLYEASVLNDAVKQKMLEIVKEQDVAGIRLNSDYNFTDAATKRYRYQAVFELTHY
jgi:hypothetical protein